MERFVKVYGYDEFGVCIGEVYAQRDKNGEIMMPAKSTELKPLKEKEGFDVVFSDGKWTYKEHQSVENEELEVEEYIPTYADKRRAEYPAVGDQLDAMWKGGEEAEAMKTKIQVIKEKYPKE